MAWVVPETRMIIFKGVPLDPDYQHTIWFETEAMQREYFRMDNGVFSYAKGTCRAFGSLTYQRNTRNIRLPVNQQDILEYNYFMYLNQAYGDKRFYGFILDTIYINDNCTEIVWQMDVLQSYLFDFELKECLVEREHSATDEIGDNVTPEDIDVSNYKIQNENRAYMHCEQGVDDVNFTKHDMVYFLANVDRYDIDTDVYFNDVWNVYCACGIAWFDVMNEDHNGNTQLDSMINWIDSLTSGGREDAIIAGWQVPYRFYEFCLYNETVGWPDPYETVTLSRSSTIDGYVPKNNKLFTYPYCFVRVFSYNADSKDYRWELCCSDDRDAGEMKFTVCVSPVPVPSMSTWPEHYGYSDNNLVEKGIAYNQAERVTVTDFPQMAYNIDAYKSWLSQQPYGIVYDEKGPVAAATYSIGYTLGHFFAGAATAATNIRRQANNAASTSTDIKSYWHEAIKAMRDANELKNYSGSCAMSTQLQDNDFHYYQMTVRANEAKIIDDYFTYFGYNTMRLKVPNTGSRKYWNYVKTANCMLESGNHFNDTDAATISIPADVQSDIQAIFNKGITLWHGPYFVNEYNEHDNECTGLEGFQRPTAPTT